MPRRRPRRAIALLTLSALTAAACSGDDSDPLAEACDGYNDLLVTTLSSEDSPSHLALVHEDGRDPEPLTDDRALALEPSFSPDGTEVVFARGPAADPGDRYPYEQALWTIGIDGEGLRQLTGQDAGDVEGQEGPSDREPDWSSTGTIAFVRSPHGEGVGTRIHVVGPGGDARPLLPEDDGSHDDALPAWSSDGEQLAFVRVDDGTVQLWVVAADGTGARAVADLPPIPLTDLTWSPDGGRISLGTDYSTDPTLRAVDLASRELTVAGSSGAGLTFSADGDRLFAFTLDDAKAWRLTYLRLEQGEIVDVQFGVGGGFIARPSDGLDSVSCAGA